MFFGVPSVATRVGGIPEVVQDGATGLLVDFGNVEKLAKAVESLIHDAALRKKLGEAARADASRRFSTGVIISRYEDLYNRLAVERREKTGCPEMVEK